MGVAEDIIRYMAYGPLSIANPDQITDDPNSYKMEGDIRGLPTSVGLQHQSRASADARSTT